MIERDNEFSIVVADATLSPTTVWELISAIKGNWPTVPTVVVDPEPSPNNALRAWSLSTNHYLPKANCAGVLRQLVLDIIASSS
jgi:hypothetical protein